MKPIQYREVMHCLAQKCIEAEITMPAVIADFKAIFLEELLAVYGNNQCHVAKASGLHRNTVSRLLRACGIVIAGKVKKHE